MAEALDLRDPHTISTRYWHRRDDGRVQCDVCPRACKLGEGQRGVCFVRGRIEDQIVLASYGRSSGFCLDPIEKKPLNHFLPGTSVLSFGTAGCNLACRFCQNWDISKSKQVDTLSASASPEEIAKAALEAGCASVAYTYNDPTVFFEYAVDTAAACRELGVRSVAVTAGYINSGARAELIGAMDAVNVDLKAFSEEFYSHVAMAALAPVLETLEYIVHETDTWLEITTLLIPQMNDSDAEISQLCEWVIERLGAEVPLHFTAFHPDFKMLETPRTPTKTLTRARMIAKAVGLRHVYTGNVADLEGGATTCVGCGREVVRRDRYRILSYDLDESGNCEFCDTALAGVFDGPVGNWGPRRETISMPQSS